MCGIAGMTGPRNPDALAAMLGAIAHRGPDDEGHQWIEAGHDRWVGMGNRRLAILDLSAAGHQPMADGDDVLVYNGEVYNFRELRAELGADGVRFASGSDTEVVLHLLRRQGVNGLQRLNGMFALAFWDASERELVLARDRFGIKPLYYSFADGDLTFGSEAKCLFAAGRRAAVDVSSLGAYLSFGWVPGTATIYDGVRELAPGHVMRWRDGEFTIATFRDVVPEPDDTMTGPEGARAMREALTDAVRRQMIADVPVGVLLSGGLDSSAIAALAAQESSKQVHAYTIGFKSEDAKLEQSGDDAQYARVVAQHFGLELHEFVVEADIAQLLETVAWHLDDPVADPAAILTLLISRAAASDVKVLLSGQGADELLGGYRVHVFDRLARLVTRQPALLRKLASEGIDLLPAIAGRLPVKQGLALAGHRAARNVLDNAELLPEARYIGFRGAYYFSGDSLAGLLSADARPAALADDPRHHHMGFFGAASDLDFFDRMLYVDFKTFLANQNLAYSDRMSMAASIEMRVPFLDDVVADLALATPAALKLRRLRGKQVLRKSMEGLLPHDVIYRRKAGFGAPIRSWLRGDLRPLVEDALSDTWLAKVGLFDRAAVRRVIDGHVSGAEDHTYRLWTLLTFALWHRTHVERVPHSE